MQVQFCFNIDPVNIALNIRYCGVKRFCIVSAFMMGIPCTLLTLHNALTLIVIELYIFSSLGKCGKAHFNNAQWNGSTTPRPLTNNNPISAYSLADAPLTITGRTYIFLRPLVTHPHIQCPMIFLC